MYHVVKSRLCTGVAMLGAGAIAFAPTATPLPEITAPAFSTQAVDLTANPRQFYSEVISRALANVEQLADILLVSPAPILEQVIANQLPNIRNLVDTLGSAATLLTHGLFIDTPAKLQEAVAHLTAGNVEGFVNTIIDIPVSLGMPLIGLLNAIAVPAVQALTNLGTVVREILPVVNLLLPVAIFGPPVSALGSIGTALQNVLDAFATGHPGAVIDAVLNAPATLIDGLLNGGYGPKLAGLLDAPGLLSPAGPLAALLNIRNAIAAALGWQPTVANATVAAQITEFGSTTVDPVVGESARTADVPPSPVVGDVAPTTDPAPTGTGPADEDAVGPVVDGEDEPSSPSGSDADRSRNAPSPSDGVEEVSSPEDEPDSVNDAGDKAPVADTTPRVSKRDLRSASFGLRSAKAERASGHPDSDNAGSDS